MHRCNSHTNLRPGNLGTLLHQPAGKVNMSDEGRKLNVRADKYKVNREGDDAA